MAKKTWIDAHEGEQFSCGCIEDVFPGCKGCIFAAPDDSSWGGAYRYGYNHPQCQKYPKKTFNKETEEYEDAKPEEYNRHWNEPCPYKKTK